MWCVVDSDALALSAGTMVFFVLVGLVLSLTFESKHILQRIKVCLWCNVIMVKLESSIVNWMHVCVFLLILVVALLFEN